MFLFEVVHIKYMWFDVKILGDFLLIVAYLLSPDTQIFLEVFCRGK
jgi:hypothetical protein